MQPERYLTSPLLLTLAMVTCLSLLINISFKVFVIQGMMFTASSVLCPVIACLYLFVSKECNLVQQRHVLNQSLLALYIFSLGVYLLVNLPAPEYMLDQSAYQIVFQEIPRKFFAATLAFAVSFYLPHFLFSIRDNSTPPTPKQHVLLTLFGGFSFFTLDFLLLFTDSQADYFNRIFLDSFILVAVIMLSVGTLYLAFIIQSSLRSQKPNYSSNKDKDCSEADGFENIYEYKPVVQEAKHLRRKRLGACTPWYNYLVSFSVIVLLISQSCEYRLVTFGGDFSLVASGILFPLIIVASNLIGELYGLNANLRLTIILIITELAFDAGLMLAILLPSPDFLDLNPYYSFIMPRRVLANTIALTVTFVANSFLLEKLKQSSYGENRGLRILMANLIVNSLLCLVNYILLFTGVYSYDQIINLLVTSWTYKFAVTLLSIPLILWLFQVFRQQERVFV